MKKSTNNTYTLCEACHRPIRDGEGYRLINSCRLHIDDECLYAYSQKVEKGIIKVPANTGTKALRTQY